MTRPFYIHMWKAYTLWFSICAVGAVLILVPLFPFLLLPDNGESLKAAASIFAISLCVIAFAMSIAYGGVIPAGLRKIDLLFTVLVFYIFLQMVILGHQTTMRHWHLLSMFITYAVIRCMPQHCMAILLLFIIGSGFVQSLLGVVQYLGLLRPNGIASYAVGSFNNSGPYGGYIAMTVVLTMVFYIHRDEFLNTEKYSRWQRWIKSCLQIFMFFEFAALVYSGSRTAWMAIVVSFIVLFHHKIGKWSKKMSERKKWLGMALLAFVLIAFVSALILMNPISANSRFYIWTIALRMMNRGNFLFGVGYDKFSLEYMLSQENFLRENPESPYMAYADNTNYCFNDIMQAGLELGVLGLVLLIFMIYVVWRASLLSNKVHDSDNSGLSSFLAYPLLCILIFSLFSYPLTSVVTGYSIIAIIAVLISNSDSKRKDLYIKRSMTRWSFLAVVAGISFVGIYCSCQFIRACCDWKYSRYLLSDFRYQESVLRYEKAYGCLKNEGIFLNDYGKALSLSKRYEKSNEIMHDAIGKKMTSYSMITLGHNHKMLGRLQEAENCYWRAYWMAPKKEYPLYLLVKLYEESGKTEQAKKLGRKMLNRPAPIKTKASEQIRNEVMNIIIRSK